MLLFDFMDYMKELESSDKKYKMIQYYYKFYGRPTQLEDCSWYKDYIGYFDIAEDFSYEVPEELKYNFD